MQGLNGFDTKKLIREKERRAGDKRLHIAMTNAHAMGGDKERSISSTYGDSVAKPFNPALLRDKLSGSIARLYSDLNHLSTL